MEDSSHLMNRVRSLIAALAALALTAGLAAAHVMPSASDKGISTAQQASGKSVPLGVDGSVTDRSANNDTNSPPSDTHGAAVSKAAQSETPAGFDNHGAYVSSIAKGWGQQTSAAHRNPASLGHTPEAATQGLSHRP
jgi:hypothetical protein